MTPTTPDISDYFELYAKTSLSGDSRALAKMYAPTFIVAGPSGSKGFTNGAQFVEWLNQVHEFNQKHGMQALKAVSVDAQSLSPMHTLANVRWAVRFEKTGERIIEFNISYLVEKAGDSWKILTYVSETDQDEEMKKLGLLD